MARFKNKDLRLDTNEEVLLGDSQEASLSYDGADLVSSLPIYAATVPSKDQHLTNKTFVDSEITDVRTYIDDVVKGLEWQNSVLSKTTSIPTSGDEGDRYIAPSGGDWIAFDPSNKSVDLTLSNNNFTVTRTALPGWDSALCTTGKSSGKWYWEITADSIGDHMVVGVGIVTADVNNFPGGDGNSWGYYSDTGNKYHDGSPTGYGDTWKVDGDVIGVALDMDNNKIWFAKNGVWQNSGDPAAGTNEAYTVDLSPLLPMLSVNGQNEYATINTGLTSFTYGPPAGFEAFNYNASLPDFIGDDVVEWETSTWNITTPSAGFATWVEDEGAYYIYSESTWSRMGTVVDHSVLDNLDVDDHTQYLLVDGTRGVTGTLQAVTISAGTFEGPGFDHDNLINTHNLTTDIDHNSITNNHNLTTDIDHSTITNTHNLTTDISHSSISDLGSDDHTQYLLIDGTRGMTGTLTVSGNILPGGGTVDIGSVGAPFDDIYCNTLHTSAGSLLIGTTTLSDVGGDLTSNSTIIAPSGLDPNALVTMAVLAAERGEYGFGHDHDDRYYTQTELDNGQLDDRYYTETEIDTNFAPASHGNVNHSETYITAAGVTYENLGTAGDIGTASTQVSQGDHTHGATSQAGWQYGSQVATASGTTVVLTTSIPTSATEVEVILKSVSTGSDDQVLLVQVGGSGGYKTSGYESRVAPVSGASVTAGFGTNHVNYFDATDLISGVMRLIRWDTSEDIWFSVFQGYVTSNDIYCMSAGQVNLGENLDRIRLNTSGGATFDAGEARVRWR